MATEKKAAAKKTPATKTAATKTAVTKTVAVKTATAKSAATEKISEVAAAAAEPHANPASAGTKHHPAPTHEEIAKEAYLLWLDHGKHHGRDAHHWETAERQLREAGQQHKS